MDSVWFPQFSPPRPAAQMRVFCFGPAGGGAATFREWCSLAPPHLEIVPVELPGHGTRLGEKPISKMNDLVDEVARGLATKLDRPFSFVGHSMGAKLALVLSARDRMANLMRFVVCASSAPHVPRRKKLARLPTTEFFRELEALGGIPREVLRDRDIMELFEPVLRADFVIVDDFFAAPNKQLRCDVLAFAGTDDLDSPPSSVQAWARFTRGQFRYNELQGGHFIVQSHRDVILKSLADDLAGSGTQSP
jgi:medium-chain acyl-[acyl-carrier-protein] hydrolase